MSNGDTPKEQPVAQQLAQPAAAPEIKVEAVPKIEVAEIGKAEIGKKDLARVDEADKKTREDGGKIVAAEVRRMEGVKKVG